MNQQIYYDENGNEVEQLPYHEQSPPHVEDANPH